MTETIYEKGKRMMGRPGLFDRLEKSGIVVRQVQEPTPGAERPVLGSAKAVNDYVASEGLNISDREIMTVLHLSTKNQLIFREMNSLGTIDSAAVYPREIFKSALLAGTSSIVLVHNHPSGSPDPSPADVEITRDILAAAKLLGIRVLDHVVISPDGKYYSFADNSNLFYV